LAFEMVVDLVRCRLANVDIGMPFAVARRNLLLRQEIRRSGTPHKNRHRISLGR
jgi:hypothetical protein